MEHQGASEVITDNWHWESVNAHMVGLFPSIRCALYLEFFEHSAPTCAVQVVLSPIKISVGKMTLEFTLEVLDNIFFTLERRNSQMRHRNRVFQRRLHLENVATSLNVKAFGRNAKAMTAFRRLVCFYQRARFEMWRRLRLMQLFPTYFLLHLQRLEATQGLLKGSSKENQYNIYAELAMSLVKAYSYFFRIALPHIPFDAIPVMNYREALVLVKQLDVLNGDLSEFMINILGMLDNDPLIAPENLFLWRRLVEHAAANVCDYCSSGSAPTKLNLFDWLRRVGRFRLWRRSYVKYRRKVSKSSICFPNASSPLDDINRYLQRCTGSKRELNFPTGTSKWNIGVSQISVLSGDMLYLRRFCIGEVIDHSVSKSWQSQEVPPLYSSRKCISHEAPSTKASLSFDLYLAAVDVLISSVNQSIPAFAVLSFGEIQFLSLFHSVREQNCVTQHATISFQGMIERADGIHTRHIVNHERFLQGECLALDEARLFFYCPVSFFKICSVDPSAMSGTSNEASVNIECRFGKQFIIYHPEVATLTRNFVSLYAVETLLDVTLHLGAIFRNYLVDLALLETNPGDSLRGSYLSYSMGMEQNVVTPVWFRAKGIIAAVECSFPTAVKERASEELLLLLSSPKITSIFSVSLLDNSLTEKEHVLERGTCYSFIPDTTFIADSLKNSLGKWCKSLDCSADTFPCAYPFFIMLNCSLLASVYTYQMTSDEKRIGDVALVSSLCGTQIQRKVQKLFETGQISLSMVNSPSEARLLPSSPLPMAAFCLLPSIDVHLTSSASLELLLSCVHYLFVDQPKQSKTAAGKRQACGKRVRIDKALGNLSHYSAALVVELEHLRFRVLDEAAKSVLELNYAPTDVVCLFRSPCSDMVIHFDTEKISLSVCKAKQGDNLASVNLQAGIECVMVVPLPKLIEDMCCTWKSDRMPTENSFFGTAISVCNVHVTYSAGNTEGKVSPKTVFSPVDLQVAISYGLSEHFMTLFGVNSRALKMDVLNELQWSSAFFNDSSTPSQRLNALLMDDLQFDTIWTSHNITEGSETRIELSCDDVVASMTSGDLVSFLKTIIEVQQNLCAQVANLKLRHFWWSEMIESDFSMPSFSEVFGNYLSLLKLGISKNAGIRINVDMPSFEFCLLTEGNVPGMRQNLVKMILLQSHASLLCDTGKESCGLLFQGNTVASVGIMDDKVAQWQWILEPWKIGVQAQLVPDVQGNLSLQTSIQGVNTLRLTVGTSMVRRFREVYREIVNLLQGLLKPLDLIKAKAKPKRKASDGSVSRRFIRNLTGSNLVYWDTTMREKEAKSTVSAEAVEAIPLGNETSMPFQTPATSTVHRHTGHNLDTETFKSASLSGLLVPRGINVGNVSTSGLFDFGASLPKQQISTAFAPSVGTQSSALYQSLSFRIDGFNPRYGIDIQQPRTRYLRVAFDDNHDQLSNYLQLDVSRFRESTVVSFRSLVVLKNVLPFRMMIDLQSVYIQERERTMVLNPGESVSIPLNLGPNISIKGIRLEGFNGDFIVDGNFYVGLFEDEDQNFEPEVFSSATCRAGENSTPTVLREHIYAYRNCQVVGMVGRDKRNLLQTTIIFTSPWSLTNVLPVPVDLEVADVLLKEDGDLLQYLEKIEQVSLRPGETLACLYCHYQPDQKSYLRRQLHTEENITKTKQELQANETSKRLRFRVQTESMSSVWLPMVECNYTSSSSLRNLALKGKSTKSRWNSNCILTPSSSNTTLYRLQQTDSRRKLDLCLARSLVALPATFRKGIRHEYEGYIFQPSHLSLYCPWWIMNTLGVNISGSETLHTLPSNFFSTTNNDRAELYLVQHSSIPLFLRLSFYVDDTDTPSAPVEIDLTSLKEGKQSVSQIMLGHPDSSNTLCYNIVANSQPVSSFLSSTFSGKLSNFVRSNLVMFSPYLIVVNETNCEFEVSSEFHSEQLPNRSQVSNCGYGILPFFIQSGSSAAVIHRSENRDSITLCPLSSDNAWERSLEITFEDLQRMCECESDSYVRLRSKPQNGVTIRSDDAIVQLRSRKHTLRGSYFLEILTCFLDTPVKLEEKRRLPSVYRIENESKRKLFLWSSGSNKNGELFPDCRKAVDDMNSYLSPSSTLAYGPSILLPQSSRNWAWEKVIPYDATVILSDPADPKLPLISVDFHDLHASASSNVQLAFDHESGFVDDVEDYTLLYCEPIFLRSALSQMFFGIDNCSIDANTDHPLSYKCSFAGDASKANLSSSGTVNRTKRARQDQDTSSLLRASMVHDTIIDPLSKAIRSGTLSAWGSSTTPKTQTTEDRKKNDCTAPAACSWNEMWQIQFLQVIRSGKYAEIYPNRKLPVLGGDTVLVQAVNSSGWDENLWCLRYDAGRGGLEWVPFPEVEVNPENQWTVGAESITKFVFTIYGGKQGEKLQLFNKENPCQSFFGLRPSSLHNHSVKMSAPQSLFDLAKGHVQGDYNYTAEHPLPAGTPGPFKGEVYVVEGQTNHTETNLSSRWATDPSRSSSFSWMFGRRFNALSTDDLAVTINSANVFQVSDWVTKTRFASSSHQEDAASGNSTRNAEVDDEIPLTCLMYAEKVKRKAACLPSRFSVFTGLDGSVRVLRITEIPQHPEPPENKPHWFSSKILCNLSTYLPRVEVTLFTDQQNESLRLIAEKVVADSSLSVKLPRSLSTDPDPRATESPFLSSVAMSVFTTFGISKLEFRDPHPNCVFEKPLSITGVSRENHSDEAMSGVVHFEVPIVSKELLDMTAAVLEGSNEIFVTDVLRQTASELASIVRLPVVYFPEAVVSFGNLSLAIEEKFLQRVYGTLVPMFLLVFPSFVDHLMEKWGIANAGKSSFGAQGMRSGDQELRIPWSVLLPLPVPASVLPVMLPTIKYKDKTRNHSKNDMLDRLSDTATIETLFRSITQESSEEAILTLANLVASAKDWWKSAGRDDIRKGVKSKQKIYIGQFIINSFEVTVSFRRSSDFERLADVDLSNDADPDDTATVLDPVSLLPSAPSFTSSVLGGARSLGDSVIKGALSPFSVTLHALGASMSSVSGSRVKFDGLVIQNTLLTMRSALELLIKHGTKQAIQQFYRVFFDVDILGRPTTLFEELGHGLFAFLTEPFKQAYVSGNPLYLGRGLTHGSISLLSSTLTGVGKFTSGVARSLALGTSMLSFDQRYVVQRNRALRASLIEGLPALRNVNFATKQIADHGVCSRKFKRRSSWPGACGQPRDRVQVKALRSYRGLDLVCPNESGSKPKERRHDPPQSSQEMVHMLPLYDKNGSVTEFIDINSTLGELPKHSTVKCLQLLSLGWHFVRGNHELGTYSRASSLTPIESATLDDICFDDCTEQTSQDFEIFCSPGSAASTRFASAGSNLMFGGYLLSSSFLDGISGIVRTPYLASRSRSPLCTLRGFARGMMSAAAKPVTGALDFVASTGDSLVSLTHQRWPSSVPTIQQKIARRIKLAFPTVTPRQRKIKTINMYDRFKTNAQTLTLFHRTVLIQQLLQGALAKGYDRYRRVWWHNRDHEFVPRFFWGQSQVILPASSEDVLTNWVLKAHLAGVTPGRMVGCGGITFEVAAQHLVRRESNLEHRADEKPHAYQCSAFLGAAADETRSQQPVRKFNYIDLNPDPNVGASSNDDEHLLNGESSEDAVNIHSDPQSASYEQETHIHRIFFSTIPQGKWISQLEEGMIRQMSPQWLTCIPEELFPQLFVYVITNERTICASYGPTDTSLAVNNYGSQNIPPTVIAQGPPVLRLHWKIRHSDPSLGSKFYESFRRITEQVVVDAANLIHVKLNADEHTQKVREFLSNLQFPSSSTLVTLDSIAYAMCRKLRDKSPFDPLFSLRESLATHISHCKYNEEVLAKLKLLHPVEHPERNIELLSDAFMNTKAISENLLEKKLDVDDLWPLFYFLLVRSCPAHIFTTAVPLAAYLECNGKQHTQEDYNVTMLQGGGMWLLGAYCSCNGI